MEDFNEQYYDNLRKLDRDRKFMTICGSAIISILFVFGMYTCISTIRFDNKVIQDYDKCVRINGEVFCKVEK